MQGYQVKAGDGFSHRVFHLQPSVHLHEEKVSILVQQELQSSRALVANGLHSGHCGVAHALAQLGGNGRRWRLFDHFLVTALHRAVTLSEVNCIAVAVSEDLNLYVTGLNDGAFQNHSGVTKCIFGFRLGAAQMFSEFGCVVH